MKNRNYHLAHLIKSIIILTSSTKAFIVPKNKQNVKVLRQQQPKPTTTETETETETVTEIKTLVPWRPKSSPFIGLNNYFKEPVPPFIKDTVAIVKVNDDEKDKFGAITQIMSPPQYPGVPRPLWAVIASSIPTGLVWYGYYKFCIEEELMELELEKGIEPRGFGGFGTLGPFTYGLLLGPIAEIFHLPGGINWSALGIIFIYYTQFTLYDRVNELYTQMEKSKGIENDNVPLTIWWTWPIFFPLNLMVGLRQVHFLSEYMYDQRGVYNPPSDPVVDFFPFIKERNLTFKDLLLKRRLWSVLFQDLEDSKIEDLPTFLHIFFTEKELQDATDRKENIIMEERMVAAKKAEKERISAQKEAEEQRIAAEKEAKISEEKMLAEAAAAAVAAAEIAQKEAELKRLAGEKEAKISKEKEAEAQRIKEEKRLVATAAAENARKEAEEKSIAAKEVKIAEEKEAEEKRIMLEKEAEEKVYADKEAADKEAKIKEENNNEKIEKRLIAEKKAQEKINVEEKRLEDEKESIIAEIAEEKRLDAESQVEEAKILQMNALKREQDRKLAMELSTILDDDSDDTKSSKKKSRKAASKLSKRPAAKGFKKE